MRTKGVCVLGWAVFHQLLLVRAQTAPDNPIPLLKGPTPPDNPIPLPKGPTPPDNPIPLPKGPTPPDNPILPKGPTPPDNPIPLPKDQSQSLLPAGKEILLGTTMQSSCVNRRSDNGEPVQEMNLNGLWNYPNDPIPSTCPGNIGASIPGNTGQIVGFDPGDENPQPTFQAASFSTEPGEGGVASNNGIVVAAGSIPNVADSLLPVGTLGSNTIPESAILPAFNNDNNDDNNITPVAVIPGDPYPDSNNSPTNIWDKKNKRAAKLARRRFLQELHGSK